MSYITRTKFSILVSLIFSSSIALGSYQISPLKLDLSKSDKVTSLNLENNHKETKTFQVTILKKSGGSYKPSNDFVVTPVRFRLLPEGNQLIRVALRDLNTKESESHDDYRVSIQELPDRLTEKEKNTNTVRLVTNMRVPLAISKRRS